MQLDKDCYLQQELVLIYNKNSQIYLGCKFIVYYCTVNLFLIHGSCFFNYAFNTNADLFVSTDDPDDDNDGIPDEEDDDDDDDEGEL